MHGGGHIGLPVVAAVAAGVSGSESRVVVHVVGGGEVVAGPMARRL